MKKRNNSLHKKYGNGKRRYTAVDNHSEQEPLSHRQTMNRDLSIKLEPMGNLTARMASLSPAKRALLELKLEKKGPDASGKQTIPRRVNRDRAVDSDFFLDQPRGQLR